MAAYQQIAATRFGFGAGAGEAPSRPADLMARLAGPDLAAEVHPPQPERAWVDPLERIRASRKIKREGDAGRAKSMRKAAQVELAELQRDHLRRSLARILHGHDPFRERLLRFWADHLTAGAYGPTAAGLSGDYLDRAIRPHLTGRFADMLTAATLHPLMVSYLDQSSSFGPNSQLGLKMGRGLNENHARELLELHTLGADGGYAQADVRELAELMTGIKSNKDALPRFDRRIAEPGAETVLGRSYGGDPARASHVAEALSDLAEHPDTARHMARKLAVHFVSGDPDPALLRALEGAWSGTGGDLMAVYEVLVSHPAALSQERAKLRRPFEWLATCLRALGLGHEAARALGPKDTNRLLLRPLARMGQGWLRPPDPAGWPEDPAHWAQPQMLAERIAWAMRAPVRLGDLPDPRALARRAAPWGPSRGLAFAARAAERREDGVALVLVSPDLMRR